jgi:hypothetical protein
VWLRLNAWSILASLLHALGNARSLRGRGLLRVWYCVWLTMVPHRHQEFPSIFFNHFKYLAKISRLACFLPKEEACGLRRGA